MCPIPVTEGAVEPNMPIEGKEQHRTVIIVSKDVNHRVDHTAENKGQPPVSARFGPVNETPQDDGIQDERGGRVQKIVTRNPERVIEVQVSKDPVHNSGDVFSGKVAEINEITD